MIVAFHIGQRKTRVETLVFVFLCCLVGSSLSAQSCQCTACPINFLDTVPVNLTIEVEGAVVDDLSDPVQGVCGVRIDFGHDDIGQMTMELVSPAGQSVQLMGPPSLCGRTLGDVWFIEFVPCGETAVPDAGFPAVWDNCSFEGTMLQIFNGTYYPNAGCLEDFDTGPVNGDWELRFLDDSVRQFGSILDFEIIFCRPSGISCTTPVCQDYEAGLPPSFYLCEGETASIIETTGGSLTTHNWSTSDGEILSGTQRDSILIGSPGTYEVIIQGPDPQSGLVCADTSSITVTPSSFSTPSISFNRRFELDCNNDTITVFGVISNSSGDDRIIWTTVSGNIIGPNDGESIVVDREGIYNVLIENPEGCGGDFQIEVLLNLEPPIVSISNARDITCLFNQSDIILNASGSGNTFVWEGPGIDSLLINQMNQSVTEAGTYSVTVTGENGCTATAWTSIDIDTTAPQIEIQQSAPWSCFDPVISLSVNSNDFLTNYIWTGPDISGADRFVEVLEVDTANRYLVTVIDGDNGCISVDSIDVIDERVFPTLMDYSDTLQCLDTALLLDVDAMGDLLLFEWSGPDIDATNRNDSFPIVTLPGEYTVALSVDSQCVVTGTVVIDIDSLRPQVQIQADTFECGDSIATILAIPLIDGIDLEWSGPGITDDNRNDAEIITMIPGVFELLAATENGCEISYRIDVTGSGDIPFLEVMDDTLTCLVTQIELQAISDPAVDYLWTGPGIDDSNRDLPNPLVTIGGAYQVSVRDSLGCLNVATLEIITDTISPALDLRDTSISCLIREIELRGAEDASSAQWAGPGINTANQDQLRPLIDQAGIYTVEAIGLNGCVSIATMEVAADTTSPQVALSADELDCNRQEVAITNISDATAFLWSGPDISSVNETEQSPTVGLAGVYELSAFAQNGCSTMRMIEITIDTVRPTADLSAERIDCDNPVTILELMSDGDSFVWEGPGITAQNVNAERPSVSEAGDYTVLITGENGCTREISELVEIDTTAPELILTSSANAITCEDPEVILDASNSSGQDELEFSWSRLEGDPVGGFLEEPIITVDRQGTYVLELTDPANGCSSMIQILIGQDDVFPSLQIEAFDTLTCQDPELRLDGSGSEDGSDIRYAWTGPGIDGVASADVVTIAEAGVYTFAVINEATGCSRDTMIEVFSNQDLPFVELIRDGALDCFSREVSLSVGSSDQGDNYEILWTGPGITSATQGESEISVNQTGDYALMIADLLTGCESLLAFEIEGFDEIPTAMTVTTSNANCLTGELGSIRISDIIGGEGPFSIFLNDQLGELVNTDLAGGSYDVILQDANGCLLQETVSLGDIVALTLDLGEDLIIDLGERVFVDAITNKPDFLSSIRWTGDPVPCDSCLSFDFEPRESGLYILELQDTDSCRASDELYIEVQEGPSLYMPNVFSPNGDGRNDKLSPRIGSIVQQVDLFQIFDRKGHLVYEKHNFRDLGIQSGWDGRIRGNEMPSQVFTYLIRYTLISGKEIVRTGDITLVR